MLIQARLLLKVKQIPTLICDVIPLTLNPVLSDVEILCKLGLLSGCGPTAPDEIVLKLIPWSSPCCFLVKSALFSIFPLFYKSF